MMVFLVQPERQACAGFSRRLALLLEDVGEADVAHQDEVVGVEEKCFGCVQPVLVIEKTEQDVG